MDASTPESRAADQARIRKERREAKIRAGGSARLDKITGLGGGIKRDAPIQSTTSTTDSSADPEEVDISEHFYEPARPSRPQINLGNEQITDEQLRAMMLGNAMPQGNAQDPMRNPFAGFGGGAGGAPDDIGAMLAQMMGSMGGAPGEGMNGTPSFPGMPGMGMPDVPATAAAATNVYIWRIVHTVFALGLGLYIALTSNFSGSKFNREFSTMTSGESLGNMKFFYIFATVETLLQSTRFFLEKGRAPQTGMLGMVMGVLPEPYKGYLKLILRYSKIWTTVSADAMVCLFILGLSCWMRGTI